MKKFKNTSSAQLWLHENDVLWHDAIWHVSQYASDVGQHNITFLWCVTTGMQMRRSDMSQYDRRKICVIGIQLINNDIIKHII